MPKATASGPSNAGLAAEAAGPGAGRMSLAEYLAPEAPVPAVAEEEVEPSAGMNSSTSGGKPNTSGSTSGPARPRRASTAGSRSSRTSPGTSGAGSTATSGRATGSDPGAVDL